MPIYAYECKSCSDEFEILQTIGAASPEKCPRCGGPVGRLPSRTSINFGKHSSRTSERYSKVPADQQARQEGDRLAKGAKKAGIPLGELFEDHREH
jgi:putative FmdB family regulatory protein